MEDKKTGIDLILAILGSAECKTIDEKPCFIVSLTDFFRIQYAVIDGGMMIRTDDHLTRQYGYENVEFRMSTLESRRYYICAKADPILDRLWEAKTKEKPIAK